MQLCVATVTLGVAQTAARIHLPPRGSEAQWIFSPQPEVVPVWGLQKHLLYLQENVKGCFEMMQNKIYQAGKMGTVDSWLYSLKTGFESLNVKLIYYL